MASELNVFPFCNKKNLNFPFDCRTIWHNVYPLLIIVSVIQKIQFLQTSRSGTVVPINLTFCGTMFCPIFRAASSGTRGVVTDEMQKRTYFQRCNKHFFNTQYKSLQLRNCISFLSIRKTYVLRGKFTFF